MLVWNLLIGHFRDSMRAVLERGSQASTLGELLADDTFQRFWTHPFALEGLLSGLLAVVGSGCCVFAASKWLSRDDSYPGYGAVHRAAVEHQEKWSLEADQRRSDLQSIYKKYIARIRDERQKVENKTGMPALINNRSKQIVSEFRMQLRRYQDDLDSIIKAYSDENEKARNTPPPPFFCEEFLIDQDILKPPVWKVIPSTDPQDPGWEAFSKRRVRYGQHTKMR